MEQLIVNHPLFRQRLIVTYFGSRHIQSTSFLEYPPLEAMVSKWMIQTSRKIWEKKYTPSFFEKKVFYFSMISNTRFDWLISSLSAQANFFLLISVCYECFDWPIYYAITLPSFAVRISSPLISPSSVNV